MGIRDQIEKRIVAKQQEISELESQVREAKAYVQGLQEALKFIPKEIEINSEKLPEQILRHGSDMAKARSYLQKTGCPVYIDEILAGIGKAINKDNRSAVSGSLGNYARKGEIFTRTAPNTFGLIELNGTAKIEDAGEKVGIKDADDDDLPSSFGVEASYDNRQPSDEDIPF